MKRAIVLLIILAVLTPAAVSMVSCESSASGGPGEAPGRLLVIGFDGMEPSLLSEMMADGRMPNFAKVAAAGGYSELSTSMPPQSPVAWSNMISGAHPGVHQIYDFIHREVAAKAAAEAGEPVVKPFLSTSRVVPAEDPRFLPWGDDWRLPLASSHTESLRRGPAFWDRLVSHGVDTAIWRMPANYPPPEMPKGAGRFLCMCGMGTPDLLGTYGEFTLFSPHAPLAGKQVSGGRLEYLFVREHVARAKLQGPPNFLLDVDVDADAGEGALPSMTIDLLIARDPTEDAAVIEVQDHLVVLKPGEWSEWTPITFKTGVPGAPVLDAMQAPTDMPGMVRFYLKSAHPRLEVYASPINIDPKRPANPISTPAGFATDVADAVGRYYTAGIPEDTKALTHDALDEDEFLSMVRELVEERKKQYTHALASFDAGCLFFYWGHTDQLAHIFWRDRDPQHPGYDADEAAKYRHVMEDTYMEADALVGEALATLTERDTLIILSDHGFTSFRYGVNLNTWLYEHGYLALKQGATRELDLLAEVDWSRTRAYALGINSLYLNVRGREPLGIVEPGDEAHALLEEIDARLLASRDERYSDEPGGAPIVARNYITADYYPGADPRLAPDMLVGYADNYRGSWSTALGSVPRELIEPNLDRWSGDHCIAHMLVPGILVTNRRITVDDPSLSDMGVTILGVFGVEPDEAMTGRMVIEVE